MSKHTPGPWHIPSHLSGADGIGPKDGYEIITCCCCGSIGGDSKEQEIANARLIVAAPELLEALENLVLQIQDHNYGIKSPAQYETNAFVAARAAIAKAKGETL